MHVVLVKTATKHPAIGLAYLAAYLEKANIPVTIIDYFIEDVEAYFMSLQRRQAPDDKNILVEQAL